MLRKMIPAALPSSLGTTLHAPEDDASSRRHRLLAQCVTLGPQDDRAPASKQTAPCNNKTITFAKIHDVFFREHSKHFERGWMEGKVGLALVEAHGARGTGMFYGGGFWATTSHVFDVGEDDPVSASFLLEDGRNSSGEWVISLAPGESLASLGVPDVALFYLPGLETPFDPLASLTRRDPKPGDMLMVHYFDRSDTTPHVALARFRRHVESATLMPLLILDQPEDCLIGPGASGAPVTDSDGNLVGMVVGGLAPAPGSLAPRWLVWPIRRT